VDTARVGLDAEPSRFVDTHSHLVPSGDDGVQTVAEAVELCEAAARRGTRVLFATPHVSERWPLTPDRLARVRHALAEIRGTTALELRLGWELHPRCVLDRLPRDAELEGTDLLLLDTSPVDDLDVLLAASARVRAVGLRPVVAHPERSWAILKEPRLASLLVEHGCLLQVIAGSLTRPGDQLTEATAWSLLRSGAAAFVASDGHDAARPPFLDAAFALVEQRLGPQAWALFDGSAIAAP
jgi:protein-tyrosine phosphatase